MPVLRNADVFVKARADIRTQSTSGGVITLLAASAAFLLFVGQVYLYVFPDQSHTLHMSKSIHTAMLVGDNAIDPFRQRQNDLNGKIPFYFKISFLHITCESIDVIFNSEPIRGDDFSAYPSSKTKKRHTITKYKLRTAELRKIFGSEHSAEAKKHAQQGCTLIGNMRVPIVAGSLAISMTHDAWIKGLEYLMFPLGGGKEELAEKLHFINATHYIHDVRFGSKRSSTTKGLTSSGYVPPLEDRLRTFENDLFGVGKEEIHVKLIPTVHSNPGLIERVFGSGNKPYYQMSVVEHMISPETMISQSSGAGAAVPGVVLTYDVMPLAVHINEMNGDGGFFGFLSSLIGIVGGCFVTVGLFAGIAVKSVQAVAKKID